MESHETTIKRVRSKGYMKQWVNKHRKNTTTRMYLYLLIITLTVTK